MLMLPFTVITAQTFTEVIERDDEQTLVAFLQHHDINECFGRQTLLSASAQYGKLNLLRYLIKAGVQIDQTCMKNRTALMIAAEYQQLQAGKILLKAGADPIKLDGRANNTFEIALENGNQDFFNHLIKVSGMKLAQPDGPFLFRQDGNVLAHLQLLKTKNEKIKILTKVIEGPFFYKREWTCFKPDGEKLFSFQLQKDHYPSPGVYPSPSKILAISDIEGNFDAFANLLKGNKVINEDFEWVYGEGHLVLVGDFFDRGPQVTETLWLVYKLEQEAEKAGGKVHFLLGNHEAMNLRGDFRYVNPKYFVHANLFNLQYANMYAPNSILGEWLRTKNTMVKIGETIFCHGGISREFIKHQLSIKQVNEISRKYIDMDQARINNDPAAKAIFNTSEGIMWYRGYVQMKTNSEEISEILDFYKAGAVVIGHTPVNEVTKLYNGQVIAIDVPHTMGEEHQQALLIEYGQIYAVGLKGKKRLLTTAATEKVVTP